MNSTTSVVERPGPAATVSRAKAGKVTIDLRPSGLAVVYDDGRLVGSWRRTRWLGRVVPFDVRTPESTRPAAARALTTAHRERWQGRVLRVEAAIERACAWQLVDGDSIPPIPRWLEVGTVIVFWGCVLLGLAVQLLEPWR